MIPPLTIGTSAICREATAPLRTEPRHAAELGSELLFGERVMVRALEGSWAQVECVTEGATDGYLGWVPLAMLTPTVGLPPGEWPLVQPLIAWVELERTQGRRARIPLPRGARFPISERWADRFVLRLPEATLKLATDALGPVRQAEPEAVLRHGLDYLGCPYRWGGKTALGIDCSGLTQTVLALHGVNLPRDSWQQAESGSEVSPGERLPGDLAFFCAADAATDRVTHVGFVLDVDRILHASGLGQVRIDPLSERGIHTAPGAEQVSHRLLRVKRTF